MTLGLAITLTGVIGVVTLVCIAGFIAEALGVELSTFWATLYAIVSGLFGLLIPAGLLLLIWGSL